MLVSSFLVTVHFPDTGWYVGMLVYLAFFLVRTSSVPEARRRVGMGTFALVLTSAYHTDPQATGDLKLERQIIFRRTNLIADPLVTLPRPPCFSQQPNGTLSAYAGFFF